MTRPTLDRADFRAALGRFASGITVVTTRDADGRDQGMTVSAFSSLSLDPPLVLVCIGDDATISGAIAAAEHFGVSVLSEEQEALSRRFAESDIVRFDGVSFARAASGAALLDGAIAHLECRIAGRHRGGDHTIVVGEVLAASARGGRPLLHYHGAYLRACP